MIKAGIIGATGYAGQNLVWLLRQHKYIEIDFLCSHNNTNIPFSQVYPNHMGYMDIHCIDIQSAMDRFTDIDVLFIALPHGKSFELAAKALEAGIKVVDLGADFRLKNDSTYKLWYGLDHQSTGLLTKAVYGLPETNKKAIIGAELVANPGCYPTASILALTPLLSNNIIEKFSIIIDAKSGVSGAGRTADVSTLYCECNESIKAYGIASHRHTPEIEQELSRAADAELVVSFTPHLIPMNRGILATCYGTLTKAVEQDEVVEMFKEFYRDCPFVRIVDSLPETRWVKGTNLCDIAIRIDKRTNRIIVVSAIDNLIKGASGQAVQNMNIMFGLKETEGLDLLAMIP